MSDKKSPKTRFDDYILRKSMDIWETADHGRITNRSRERNIRLLQIAGRLRKNVINPDHFDSWSFVPHDETPIGANQLYRKLYGLFEKYHREEWESPNCKYVLSLIHQLNDLKMSEETYSFFDNLSIDALRLKFSMNPNWRYKEGGGE